MPLLDRESLSQYARLSLYDSPYSAHREGRAVDLFPGDRSGPSGWSVEAPSPVAGRIEAVRTVRAPSKPHAEAEDHLIVVSPDGDGGVRPDPRAARGEGPPDGHLARIVHVDPSVNVGDRVAVGDSLGRLVRSGYYAPWVDNHLHLGVRPAAADPVRASGSLRLGLGATLVAVPWNGVGRVADVGETYVRLDAPEHPAPGQAFAGVEGAPGVALDGGLPHYEGGGAHVADPLAAVAVDVFRLAGYPVGVAASDDEDEDEDDGDGPRDPELADVSGATVEALAAGGAGGDDDPDPSIGPRDVEWGAIEVRANGDPVVGVSLTLGREDAGVKIVAPDHAFERGDRVELSAHPTE